MGPNDARCAILAAVDGVARLDGRRAWRPVRSTAPIDPTTFSPIHPMGRHNEHDSSPDRDAAGGR
jgi:hypothetical protein